MSRNSSFNRTQYSNDIVDLFGPSITGILTGSIPLTPTRDSGPKIPVDIINEEKTIYIYAELPGVPKESIVIDFYNNKLTICAEKIKTYDSAETGEIVYGRFERTLTMPICVTRRETVSVTYNNGILRIKINKLIEEENKFSVSAE